MNRGKRLVNMILDHDNDKPPSNSNKENQLNHINTSSETIEPFTLIVLNENDCYVEKLSNLDEVQTQEVVTETSNLIQIEDLFPNYLSETFEENIQSIFSPQVQEVPVVNDLPSNVFYQDPIPLTTDLNTTRTADSTYFTTTATTASPVTASSTQISIATSMGPTNLILNTINTLEIPLPDPTFDRVLINACSAATTIVDSEPLSDTFDIPERAETELTSHSSLLTCSILIPTTECEPIAGPSHITLRTESNRTICSDPNNHNMNEGRKRSKKAEPMNWKRNLNKRLRMEGKSYTGFRVDSSKKILQDTPRNQREMKPACNKDKCIRSKTKKCSKFTLEQQTQIFKKFWSLNWDERKAFVCGHVSKIEKLQNTVSGRNSRRQFTLKYRLSTGRFEENLEVCREMFINTLGIGYRMVQSWINKGSFEMPGPSTSSSSDRVTNNVKVAGLRNFLTLLPKMPSHYGRQNSSKLYLEPIFKSLQDLYQFYCDKCKGDGIETVSRRKLSEVLASENISLFQLKKDRCNICKGYEAKNITDEVWNEHDRKKNLAREHKENDKRKALADSQIVIEVDFQAVKLAPFTNANAFYYKTKLACHNYTCYNVKTKKATCYWFSEDQNNQLVASSFVSCLIDFLEKYCLTPDKKDIVIFSDGCTAQNRNNIMSNALLNFSMLHRVNIYQKYLEVGHTQMEVDSVHGCIERKLKGREIKLPSDYVNVTKEARKNPFPYEALDLKYDFFKDYTQPLRYKSIRPGRNKNDPTVMDIKVIAYSPDGLIEVKLDFDGDFLSLPNRPTRLDPVREYQRLYTERCKIHKSKWLHLQELKSVIPRDSHDFYDNLPYKE